MFSHDSTDNLLDNLESELAEMIELQQPKVKSPQPVKKRTPPPVPARRNVQPSIDHHPAPIAASRSRSSLDKKEKNDENEIIQLQSLTSDHDSITSESQPGNSKNTVIVMNEKKTKDVRVVHEMEKVGDNETFFVIKHGKWASDHEEGRQTNETADVIKVVEEERVEEEERQKVSSVEKKPVKASKKRVKKKKRESQSSTTSASHTSADTSSTESSSLEESPLPIKKKSRRGKGKRKEKKEEERSASSCTESGSKKDDSKVDMTSADKAIGE
jgi:hypothetical protein